MKPLLTLSQVILLFLVTILSAWKTDNAQWISEKHSNFDFHYAKNDKAHKNEYLLLVDQGIKNVTSFFHLPYKKHFDVLIQPTRASFDQAYQKNYKQPNFKSDCWLVATGDSYRINILSPGIWATEPCNSRYSEYADKIKTQKLITHELIHVFHGQLNKNPVLDNGVSMDWFSEGLAFYAAGQLDNAGLKDVKKAIAGNKVPGTLDAISTYDDINLRYELAGSILSYIDKTYGREKFKSLLIYSQKKEILFALGITEVNLLSKWRTYAASR